MKRKPLNPMIAIENAQLLAIEGILTNSLESFERKIRRWFSKEHATAYLDTFKLPWDELLLHYYESNLANKSYNEVFDLAVEEFLPEFIQEQDKLDKDLEESLVKQQKAQQRANKANAGKGEALKKEAKGTTNAAVKPGSKAQSIKKVLDDANKPKPKTMSLKFDDNGGPDGEPDKGES